MKNQQLQKVNIEVYKQGLYKLWYKPRGKQSFKPMTDRQIHTLAELLQEIHSLIDEYIEPGYRMRLNVNRLSKGQAGKHIQALQLYKAAVEVIGSYSSALRDPFSCLEAAEIDFYEFHNTSKMLSDFLPDLTEELCGKYLGQRNFEKDLTAQF